MSHDTTVHLFDVKCYDQVIRPEVLACLARKDPAAMLARLKTSPEHGWDPMGLSPHAVGMFIHYACSRFQDDSHICFEGGIHQDLERLSEEGGEESVELATDLFETRWNDYPNLEPWARTRDWGFQGFLRNEELKELLPKVDAIQLGKEDDYLADLVALFRRAAKEGWGLSCWAG